MGEGRKEVLAEGAYRATDLRRDLSHRDEGEGVQTRKEKEINLVHRFREFIDANDLYVKALKEEVNRLYADNECLRGVIKDLNARIGVLEGSTPEQGSQDGDERQV